jgi:Flp pilus assembly pilin Flp
MRRRRVAADAISFSGHHVSKTQFDVPKEEGRMMSTLTKLWKDEEGQDLVEYALLVVLIGLGAVAAMKNLASGISDAFSNAVAQLTTT